MDLFKAVEKVLNDYYECCSKLDMGPGKAADVLPVIFEKARKNPKFRKRILAAPVDMLAQEGFELPKGFNLRFVEETADTIYLPLLPFIGEEYKTGEERPLTQLDEIIQKANADMEYRNQLIKTPRKVLQKKGFKIDSQKNVKVLECTDDVFYAVLPAAEIRNEGETASIKLLIEGDTCRLSGRLDAIGVEKIRNTLLNWDSDLNLDLKMLDYISSAGLGLFLMTYKKLNKSSCKMRLFNLKPEIRNIFILAGFDTLFHL